MITERKDSEVDKNNSALKPNQTKPNLNQLLEYQTAKPRAVQNLNPLDHNTSDRRAGKGKNKKIILVSNHLYKDQG